MQQYFVKGSAISPITIEDKETSKHMFQVMRLKEDDEVTLVFDDGVKRLARVLDVEARQQAVRRYQDEELRKLQNRTKPTKAKTETQVQPSLFDFGL